ncbi:MAG: L,D-transpeptidase family protein [Candidatus Baumannia cicadellinicola]|nr:L,D-transpeptidase family protein [Candidatus Baumannia cicadellinicola]MBS0032866.1 L,D-transpeptidase family protein [Candidatus Baumannia cicadellinicola]
MDIIKLLRFYLLLIIFFSSSAVATIYPLPKGKSRLIGHNKQITIPENNLFPLEYFSAKFSMGISNMLEANPDVDVYLPESNTNLIFPTQLILPDTKHIGIIINIAEMRLYYYPKGTNKVVVLPVGIGELGQETPCWVTSVHRKKHLPSWTPSNAIKKEYKARGIIIPDVFPAGANNPMGLYALYIGNSYAIHGTNANFGIGLRISHGCIRLRDNDLKYLFDHVPVGVRVELINEPVKACIEPNGNRYLEVHDPLSTTAEQFNSHKPVPIHIPSNIANIIFHPSVNKDVVNKAIQRRSGMPISISMKNKAH